jgi:SPP1 family predicted phage head-tail adaptor
MIKAGNLNRLVTIMQKTITYDTVNEPMEAWAEAGEVWARKETIGGREFVAAQKRNAETDALFVMRYTTAINHRNRIRDGYIDYEIVEITPVDDALHISAKAVV